MALICITNDLFDIADRLKSVDGDYVLYFNTDKRRYEVRNTRGEFQFALPFDGLDARAVEYARYTRVERAKQLFDEVEKHNASLEKQLVSRAVCDISNGYVRRSNET